MGNISTAQKKQAFNICVAQVTKLQNGEPAPNEISEAAEQSAPIFTGAQNRMIILALDYKGTGNALTCTIDGNNMLKLAKQCGAEDVVTLYNNQAHKDAVLQAIAEVGGRCQEGDYFIFNYSGHGANVPDKDGDEGEDGQDEALCLVTPDGKIDWNGFLTDDEFAEAVCNAIPEDSGVNILIMCDCCHSGTIGDFSDTETWGGRKAISMSGCADDQTSGDTGRGGIWTHALLMAIAQYKEDGEDDYSVGQLYNMQQVKDDTVFNSQQDIQLMWTDALSGPEDMAWPLIPPGEYSAPWRQ